MAIDIFNPEVSKVAHGLEGKVLMIYGTNNVGKTYQAVRMKKPYVLACESGLNAQANVRHGSITNWMEFRKAISQFTDPKTIKQAKELYSTIIIDEVYASSLFCQKFICDTYGGGCISLGANENSKVNLYSIYERIYWEQINKLVSAGYTVVFIAHQTIDSKTEYISPKGDKRCLSPIIDNCDFVIYLAPNGVDENGQVIKSSAYLAQTDKYFARTRFDYMTTYIPEFTAEALEKAICDAIAKQEDAEGIQSVDFVEQQAEKDPEILDFESLMEEIQALGMKLAEADKVELLTDIVENTLGVGKKVSECNKKQTESMAIILEDIKQACSDLGIE